MWRKAFIFVLLALLALSLAAVPVFAIDEGTGNAAQGQEVSSGGSGSSSPGEIGGIKPVSPEQFTGKVQQLGEKLYGAASPVADTAAKLSLAAAGLLLILLIVLGAGIIRRVVGAAFAVALGLALWYGAPYIVAMVKYFVAWMKA